MEKYHENGNKLAHVLLQTATLFMLPPLDIIIALYYIDKSIKREVFP